MEMGNGFDMEAISNFFFLKKYSSERKVKSYRRKMIKGTRQDVAV